ncbi:MAG: hypothetical protein KJ645_02405 [Planctomycetes bacterium]|nr:hypothetical protein [Planctomycetota bacterium]
MVPNNDWIREGLCLKPIHCPLVADPKLDSGAIPISFSLKPAGKSFQLTVNVKKNSAPIRTVFNGPQTGQSDPITLFWDGRDDLGLYATPGAYQVEVVAAGKGTHRIAFPVNIVRLGIRSIEARSKTDGEEWQMVYFRKGGSYEFYATPAIHEYINIAQAGEMADLDLNNGNPRPSAPIHTATESPVIDGLNYETSCYNYPLCYLKGVEPRFEVTLGNSCVSNQGLPLTCGYPITGIDIRMVAQDGAGQWTSDHESISPGSSVLFTGPALPDEATRVDRSIAWSWQYRIGSLPKWIDIPGNTVTTHRIYTNVNTPYWATGASGTQYSGPWVEVAEYFYEFSQALGFDTSNEAGVQETFLHGFFGQEGGLTSAIEGVIYDTYTMGGDGGASHYYQGFGPSIRLTRLLNNHANGIYVNCSDVGGATSTMLGMLGIQNIQMVYLGTMHLRALWGIGCPAYTLNLWGSSHGFSYHHIISRDGGVTVSDACMWLDEDGDPDSLPGIPGYNCDRPWNGASGYNALSSTNSVSKSMDDLPELK